MAEDKIKRKCIKLAMLGDSKVGKTSICQRFMNLEFNENALSTIGSDKLEVPMKMKGGEDIKLIIYDTAGQERFRAIALKSIKHVQGVLVVFDVCSKESFNNVVNWLNEINENYKSISVILLGNKVDKPESEWEVTKEEAKQFAKEKSLEYFETSAKSKEGINKAFETIANMAYEKYEGSIGVQLGDTKKEKENDGGCCGGGKKRKKNK